MAVGTWTDPRTWVDGETPTGAQFNTHIRDNLNFLKNSPIFDTDVSVVGDVTVGDDLTVAGTTSLQDLMVNLSMGVVGNLQVGGAVTLGTGPANVITIAGTVVGAPLKTYSETRTDPVITAGALTLDCALGTYFKVALNAAVTVTITNPPPAGRTYGITVIFVADGTVRAITWPSSVKWPNNLAPTMTGPSGKRDLVTLITDDGGTTWFGIVAGQNY